MNIEVELCPKCSPGILLQNNDCILYTNPPQIHVKCNVCGYQTIIEYKPITK